MLSPIYVKFMAEMIGHTISIGALKGLDHRDNALLVMVALYCIENEDDAKKIRERLQDFGHYVCNFWDNFAVAVYKHNLEGVQDATNPVNDLLGRLKNVG